MPEGKDESVLTDDTQKTEANPKLSVSSSGKKILKGVGIAAVAAGVAFGVGYILLRNKE